MRTSFLALAALASLAVAAPCPQPSGSSVNNIGSGNSDNNILGGCVPCSSFARAQAPTTARS